MMVKYFSPTKLTEIPFGDHQINLSEGLVCCIQELLLDNDMKPAHWILAQINILILGTETCIIIDG